MRGGGKWGIGKESYSKTPNLIFVLLYYRKFSELSAYPDVWVIPAVEAERIKKPWHDQYGIFYYKEHQHLLEPYKDAWRYFA